jgi:DNA-directed RNA polymerase subunit RPC12/RpoP
MTIDFTCQKCEGSFELEAQDLIDGTEKLVCPHCNTKAAANLVDDFTAALAELITQVAALSKKFTLSLSVESEEVEEEIEEEEEDEDDGEKDEDELEFDEDEDEDEDEDIEDEDMEG